GVEWNLLRAWDLAHLEGFDGVAFGDLAVAEADTAFVALAHLGDVVLLPTQRGNGEVVGDNGPIADEACLGIAADKTGTDDRSRDRAHLGGTEHLADLGGPELHFLVFGLEHALEGGFDLFDRGVDDRVVLDLHALGISEFRDPLGGADVEADDDRVVDGGEVDVVLGNRTDAAVDDPQLHLVAHVDLEQGVFECFHRTGDVALDDEVEGLHLARFEVFGEVLQGDPLAALGERRRPFGRFSLVGDLPGGAVIGSDEERVPGPRHGGEPEDLDGSGRSGFG